MAKVLILAGDSAEDLETMYVKYRLLEAGHEPYVAAPTTRPIKLVVHDDEPGYRRRKSGRGFFASRSALGLAMDSGVTSGRVTVDSRLDPRLSPRPSR